MKILLVIDDLGSGGAQRQLVYLAVGLKRRGHEVEILVYNPEHQFFRPTIDEAGIVVREVLRQPGFSFKVLFALMKRIHVGNFAAVISFLDSPNIYTEISRLVSWRARFLVSERSSRLGEKSVANSLIRRLLHLLATKVVANSHDHANWLRRFVWLRNRVTCVYNGYPLPPYSLPEPPKGLRDVKLLVIGRVGPEKNGLLLLEALAIFHRKYGVVPTVRWVGRREDGERAQAYCRSMDDFLAQYPDVAAGWEWLGERSDISALLMSHHALIHPSLYEGLPNVICEALMAGRPVLASRVCDHPILVREGKRGFLFEPTSAEEIADSLARLCSLTPKEWKAMSLNARKFAEKNLSLDRMVDSYIGLALKRTESNELSSINGCQRVR